MSHRSWVRAPQGILFFSFLHPSECVEHARLQSSWNACVAQEACETILFDPARCQTRGTRVCQRAHACVPAGPQVRARARRPAGQRASARAPRVRASGHTRARTPAFPSSRPRHSPHPGLFRAEKAPAATLADGALCAPPCAPPCIAPTIPAAGQPRGPHGPKPRRVCMATRDLALPQTRPGAARHPIKSTPCGTRTRNLRIRGPTPCPLGQGGRC